MPPVQPEMVDPDIAEQYRADEKACLERIDYALKKFDCELNGEAVIRNGFTQVRLSVNKITPEIKKQRKFMEEQMRGIPKPPSPKETSS